MRRLFFGGIFLHGFFGVDGPFYKLGSVLFDIMVLSIVWFIVSLPIITIGASTTALYYAATLRLTERERSPVRDFFRGFKNNFKTATLAFVTLATIAAVFIINLNLLTSSETFEVSPLIKPVMLTLQIFFITEGVFVTAYIFPLLSRFDLKYPDLFKTALRLANKHLLTSLICVLLFAFTLFTSEITGIFTAVAPGFYCYASAYFLLKVFKKYKPEIIDGDQANV